MRKEIEKYCEYIAYLQLCLRNFDYKPMDIKEYFIMKKYIWEDKMEEDYEVTVKVKLMDNGKSPEYKRKGDACLDCYAAEDITIKKGTRKLVKLGFAMELPEGYEAVIRPRSGNSSKGIDIIIGTIDETYRGEVMANVINNSKEDYVVNFGDRICQLAIRKAPKIKIEQVEILSSTVRGCNGFGSSGV